MFIKHFFFYRKIFINALVNSQTADSLKFFKKIVDSISQNSKPVDAETATIIETVLATSPLLTRSSDELLEQIQALLDQHQKVPVEDFKVYSLPPVFI